MNQVYKIILIIYLTFDDVYNRVLLSITTRKRTQTHVNVRKHTQTHAANSRSRE